MKYIVSIIFFVFIATCGYSTPQICSNTFIVDSSRYRIPSPLESIDDFNETLHRKALKNGTASCCWQGYNSCWVLKDSCLYLKSITSSFPYKYKNLNKQTAKIIKRKFIEGLLKADWYSDTLRVVTSTYPSRMDDDSNDFRPNQFMNKSKPKSERLFIFDNGVLIEIKDLMIEE